MEAVSARLADYARAMEVASPRQKSGDYAGEAYWFTDLIPSDPPGAIRSRIVRLAFVLSEDGVVKLPQNGGVLRPVHSSDAVGHLTP